MASKPRAPPDVFTSYENFLYLLAELELVVGSGRIEWSTASALAARRRMEELTARMRQLTSQLGNN
jgi:hypothetical protein